MIYILHRDGRIYEPMSVLVFTEPSQAKYSISLRAVYYAKRELWDSQKKHFESLSESEQDALVQAQKDRFEVVPYAPVELPQDSSK